MYVNYYVIFLNLGCYELKIDWLLVVNFDVNEIRLVIIFEVDNVDFC